MKIFYTDRQCSRDMEITRKWLGFISPDWHLDLNGAYEEIESMWDTYVNSRDKLSEDAKKIKAQLIEFRNKIMNLSE